MAKFDEALIKLGINFGYTGNPPTNEIEYNAMKDGIENPPTWSEVQTAINNLPDKDALKLSGKQKLLDLGLTTEEVKALIGA